MMKFGEGFCNKCGTDPYPTEIGQRYCNQCLETLNA